METNVLLRAQGCLLGQLAGDSLGGLVEFQSSEEIRRRYPNGLRELADGGTWGTLAGQPTDDSEMALLLARMLVKRGTYDTEAAFQSYRFWLDSNPFDCGLTTTSGLCGRPDHRSQANGALMRISPLGIFGVHYPLSVVGEWAAQDASLTHPNPVCLQANTLFTMAISHVIGTGCEAVALYQHIKQWGEDRVVDSVLMEAIQTAADAPPADYVHHQGWVVTAFHNALYQLCHAPNLEVGVVDTVMQGGDTDTNAAICGAILGAVYGFDAVPKQWVAKILHCRPRSGESGVFRPRPECFWPVDALELAERLLAVGTPSSPTISE